MVPVEPYARYRLSGWIKTEDVKGARGALLNLHGVDGAATAAVTGTKDWTRVQVEFESDQRDAVQVNCLLGGWGQSTGKAWYDDIAVEQIRKPKPMKTQITIDAAKAGEPVSKYVYGQFIEHLGRCIYGGIWAEMLEDRKFYYAPGAAESPWKSVGAVEMVKTDAFVGQHSPRVTAAGQPAGVVQGGLALRKGKAYVGRVWLAGDAAPVTVSLVWGDGPKDRQAVTVDKLTAAWARTDLKFTAAAADTDAGRIEITSAGKGTFRVGTASLMPADNIHGMRADTMALLKELDSPVYRWPGGNFVSGYDWNDGLGDPDRRPPRKNPAWKGVEYNDFGLDEFMVFCRILGTEPYIAVNAGLGGVESAVAELQYANAPADSPQGKRRAANGHPEPYRVKWWGIGNEMYGNWQLGHMPLADYQKKHNVFAEAFRAADPSVVLVAVGDTGPWSEGMMRNCAGHMDLISEHFYCGEKPGLWSHVRQVPDAIRRKVEAHRRYRAEFESLKGKDIRIAMDEWNYWYGPHPFGELGTQYFLKDALGIAAGINEYARASDMVFMANYAQTVNVIGCIKTTRTEAAFDTTGLVLKLYRQRFGTIPVATECGSLMDAQAAWTEDRKALTLSIVNATLEAIDVPLAVSGAKLTGSGTRYEIAGSDPMAYNAFGKPPVVQIVESKVAGLKDSIRLAPCSVTLLVLDAKAE
jgi:alpha-N-arabinofuranosidase